MYILNNNDPAPLYRQLYQQIREHVLSGRLPADSRLPSVRDLAAELSTSRNTVEAAYQELYAEGYLYSRQRSGYFVAALDQDVAMLSPPPVPPQRGRQPEPATDWPFDFHPARLDPASFPVALWRKCFLESLRASARDLSRYSAPQGEWGLRCTIQHYLERSRGVVCEPEQIVICAGLQQSLDIVAQLLKESHAALAVENPGYHLPRAVFRNNSFRIVPVAVGEAGLDLAMLKSSGATVVYVTPSHQLPMGWVMPIANRQKLIDWAAAGDRLIIEDDYDSELRYLGKPIPSLQGLHPQGGIVYLGTFSKILSPALRLSYLVLPRSLLGRYHSLFRDYFATVSLLEQRTMANFMAQGHWGRHMRRMRMVYRKKHDTLLAAIDRHFGSTAAVVGQGAGLHIVLQLPGDSPAEAEIIRRAAAQGIRLFPFAATSVTAEPGATKLLLGFGGMTAGEMERGIALLAKLCV
jgi:GntR family transcriptional regulator/MocR family aminotransferase